MTCANAETKPAAAPFEPARGAIRRGRWRRAHDGGVAAKRIAKPVGGTNEPGRARAIVQRLPHFSDQIREVGLGDERLGPELLLQLGFGEDFRTLGDQPLQQFERFGREMNDLAAAGHLPCVVVEDKRAELDLHRLRNVRRDVSPQRRICSST